MTDDVFTPEDLSQAAHYETLGPAYFSARRMAEALMAETEAAPFKDVVKKVVDEIRDAVYDYAETFIRSDLESNFQYEVYRTVKATVRALLTGEPWALQQYVLAKNYDAVAVREAVAKHAGEGLLQQRITDCEKRIAELSQSLQWEREMRSRY